MLRVLNNFPEWRLYALSPVLLTVTYDPDASINGIRNSTNTRTMFKRKKPVSFILLLAIPLIVIICRPAYGQERPDSKLLQAVPVVPPGEASPVCPWAAEVTGQTGAEAAPGNDAYANAITLNVDDPCVNGTNKQATTQGGEAYGCQGTPTKTVWYKFIATATDHFVEVELLTTNSCYLSSAVWNASGTSSPPTGSPLSCEDASGGPGLNIHNLTGLTIGNTYYVQVSYTGGGICGNNSNNNTGTTFCIQVGKPVSCPACSVPCGTVCQFNTMPTVPQVVSACTKYDLKPRINKNQWKTACFNFTAIYHSLSLQMVVNTVGCISGTVQQFNWTVQDASCGANVSSGNLSNLNATGLSVGSNYVLCYSWQAACQHNSVYPFIVSNSPLPIELMSFQAALEKDKVKIKWTTASETNNDHFEVERSTDGITFKTIENIKGAGTFSGILSYSFYDEQPLPGNAYYRLKQVDDNGSFTFSKKVAVHYVRKEDQVTIIPNPVKNEMHIKYYAVQNDLIILRITDMTGAVVLSKPISAAFEGLNLFSFTASDLKPGMYTANLMRPDKTITTRFSRE